MPATFYSRSSRPRGLEIAFIGSLLALSAAAFDAHAARSVRCGDVFAGEGELVDSCHGELVIRGGSLNLAGHTVVGEIICEGSFCEVYSDPPNGEVRGVGAAGSVGIRTEGGAAVGSGAIAVDNIVVSGFATGVAAENVFATNTLIASNSGHGIDGYLNIEVDNVIVSLNGRDGLHARLGSVAVYDSTISENGANGLRALEGALVSGSEIRDNAQDGIRNFSGLARVADTTVAGNGEHGVRTDDSDCTPTDELVIRDASVTGNGTSLACGVARACADLVACDVPRIDPLTACGTSYRMLSGFPGQSWSVCNFD